MSANCTCHLFLWLIRRTWQTATVRLHMVEDETGTSSYYCFSRGIYTFKCGAMTLVRVIASSSSSNINQLSSLCISGQVVRPHLTYVTPPVLGAGGPRSPFIPATPCGPVLPSLPVRPRGPGTPSRPSLPSLPCSK